MRENGAATIPQSLGPCISYGAFELKRSYQRNLGLAVIIAAALHIAVIGGFLLYSAAESQIPQLIPPIVFDEPIELFPPPPPVSLTQAPQVPVAAPGVVPIALGIATAVPDEEVSEEAVLASQEELGSLFDRSVESILEKGSLDSIVVKAIATELLPQRGKYVYHDEEPVAMNQVLPEYPPLALQAGIEGRLWIEALVDEEGVVRDAWVVKTSGCKAGFEEAALEAAYKIKYKPALSNGQPVAVRITYKVDFLLK
jgi:protein TonB